MTAPWEGIDSIINALLWLQNKFYCRQIPSKEIFYDDWWQRSISRYDNCFISLALYYGSKMHKYFFVLPETIADSDRIVMHLGELFVHKLLCNFPNPLSYQEINAFSLINPISQAWLQTLFSLSCLAAAAYVRDMLVLF